MKNCQSIKQWHCTDIGEKSKKAINYEKEASFGKKKYHYAPVRLTYDNTRY